MTDIATGISYEFDRAGRWSGGGTAFLHNVEHAQARHEILRGGPGSVPIIARNVPPGGRIPAGPFVLAPQNAWPWVPSFAGAAELRRVAGLRLASEFFFRQAIGVLRITSAIPQINPNSSPVIHNVLDTGFEQDLIACQSMSTDMADAAEAFVTLGSLNSYRNLVNLIRGYERYRELGGNRRLWIAGPPGTSSARRQIEHALEGVDGIVIRWQSISRPECLAVLRNAAAVVLPSKVESSPLAVLEAVFSNANVVLSRIIGHVEILSEYGKVPHECLFDPSSPNDVADKLLIAERHANSHTGLLTDCKAALSDPAAREAARISWGDRVAGWLRTLRPPPHSRRIGGIRLPSPSDRSRQ